MTKILTCMITHERLPLTKLAIESYQSATIMEHYLVVVDNASSKETTDYLQEMKEIGLIDKLILNETNAYPGFACNMGWREGLLEFDADLLHRSDNDIFYRPRWDWYTAAAFDQFSDLGEFGHIDLSDYFFYGQTPMIVSTRDVVSINFYNHDIGGSYVIRRKVWDEGIRHSITKWTHDRKNAEDHLLMEDIKKAGWRVGHAIHPLVYHLGIWWGFGENQEYYEKTYNERHSDSYVETMMQFKKEVREIYDFGWHQNA